VTEVRDAVDLEAWLTVRNANHPLDERTRDAWRATRTSGAGGPIRQFVARDGDRPIGSVTLFVDEATDTAGLYHVDVVPESRGRGIGTAVTLAALSAARAAGVNRAVLTATEPGARLYRGLGFEVVGEVTVFGDTTP
jgi:ribosomal protein S18 acetylase RimI-like enzyme